MIAAAYENAVPSRARDLEPLGPHKEKAAWVFAIYKASGLTKDAFAQKLKISRMGLDNMLNGRSGLRGSTLDKLVRAAPEPLKSLPWLRPIDAALDLDRTALHPVENSMGAGDYLVKTDQGRIIAKMLDAIEDESERTKALRRCLDVLEEPHHPPELSAEKRPDRAQRK